MQHSDPGEIIQKRRMFLKLTQQQLAEYAGISLRSLKSIESGSGNPTIQQLTKVLEILGMRLNIEVK
ncbi:MAG: helix-turn-helix domain-containing protein [Ignavibacteriaceae bacterium]|nr:helix-turn-helix domain-containing protein [Ignavibacteriaceae bacterium]